MAKKYKSTKLIKPSAAVQQKPGSAFGKHANRLADARKRKIQKLTDTQKRVLQSRKNNKMIKISKKAKKFALLDQQAGQPDQQLLKTMSLTHKGVSIKDMKRFDDVNLGQSDLENDDEFDEFQEKMHFAGFEASGNLLEEGDGEKGDDSKREKSKNEVYKQIIQKSKAYKMLRQQQYEQNFNLANQLDDNFDQLLSQLKFRNKDQQMLQRLQHRDLQYDKLMNQLKDDQRIVSNKIVQKNEKYTQRIRKRKNDQLNKLMRDSSDEEDIRGWVDGEAAEDQEGQSESGEEQQGEGEEEDVQQGQEEYDELDDVQLSSEDQQQEQEGDHQAQQQGDEQAQQAQQDQQEQQQGDDSSSQQNAQLEGDFEEQQDSDQQQQQDDEDQSQQQEEQQSESYQEPVFTKNNKKQLPAGKPQQQQQLISRQNPQKKRKLNFVE